MSFLPKVTVGTTAERPVDPQIGAAYYDTTLSKMVYWTGLVWHLADGTEPGGGGGGGGGEA